ERFVRETLLAQHTRELGYRVSDAEVLQALRSEPAFQLEGQFSAAVARSRLAQAGLSEQQFEDELRSSLRAEQLEAGIRNTDFMTPSERQRLRALASEERQIRYAVLPLDKFAPPAPIDDKAIQSYYEQHKTEFMTPESVRVQYAELRMD